MRVRVRVRVRVHVRVRVRVRMWNNDLFFLTLQWANLVCFKLLE